MISESFLISKGINVTSVGGQWLTLLMEEASIAQQEGRNLSFRKFIYGLYPDYTSDRELKNKYTAAMGAATQELYKVGIRESVKSFVENSVSSLKDANTDNYFKGERRVAKILPFTMLAGVTMTAKELAHKVYGPAATEEDGKKLLAKFYAPTILQDKD